MTRRNAQDIRPPLSGIADLDLNTRYQEARDRDIRRFLQDDSTKAFRLGQFIKATVGGDPAAARWCRENEVAIVKATQTQTNIAGGVLVPEELANDILILQESYGVVRQEARRWPMVSDREQIPRATSGFTTQWMTEGQVGNYVQPAFDAAGLTARKLAAFGIVSSELLEDAGEKLGAYWAQGISLAFAEAEDMAAFVGDGTSTYSGIEGITKKIGAAGKISASGDAFSNITATDIGSAIGTLPKRALRNAKIYISLVGYGATLVRLAGTSGGLVATIDAQGNLRANWHGLPVVITQALPTSTGSLSGQMMFAVGDLNQAVAFGMRRDVTIQWFQERLADQNQVLVRATERVDIDAHDLGNASTVGAIVGVFGP